MSKNKFMRKHKGSIQVAVDHYENADNRKVVLYGMVHVGDVRFYHEVQGDAVDFQDEGWEVHYEKILKDSETPPKISPDMRRIAGVLGLVHQMDYMNYLPNWKRTDMTISEFLSHSSQESIEKSVKLIVEMEETLDYLLERNWGRTLIKGLFKTVFTAMGVGFFSGALTKLNKEKEDSVMRPSVVIDARNKIALNAIDNTSKDVVALWGAAHLPGLGEGLVERGFTKTRQRWVTAIDSL